MLLTLIPLFDRNMTVSAYSLFTQKKNFLTNPNLLGSGQYDGATQIDGLEIINHMGTATLSGGKKIFVSVSNVSIFSDIESQCDTPHKALVLLIDNTFPPVEMYLKRIRELKNKGYQFALRKLPVRSYEDYRELLKLMDYILIDHQKIDVGKAKNYFNRLYPGLKVCAGNLPTTESFNLLRSIDGIELFEGSFFRMPVTKGETQVVPLKVNYIELLNLVNNEDFELTQAADIISRDTALVISLLRMANNIAINSEITSIRFAASMLGQKELKRWINTAVVNELCSEKPNEITRLSLLRAKFAENLASVFGIAMQSSELFLMGLFSVLDIILDKPMKDALSIIKVSKPIQDALIDKKGPLADVLDFLISYESADWQEVSRVMIIKNIEIPQVYNAYLASLQWYSDLVSIR